MVDYDLPKHKKENYDEVNVAFSQGLSVINSRVSNGTFFNNVTILFFN